MIDATSDWGLIFDCSLSWTHHIADVCCELSYFIFVIGMFLTIV